MEKQHAELMYVYKKEPNSKAKEQMLAVLSAGQNDSNTLDVCTYFGKLCNSKTSPECLANNSCFFKYDANTLDYCFERHPSIIHTIETF